jgi:signal transduction histidine kinase
VGGRRLVSSDEYDARLQALVPTLAVDRLLLLDPHNIVVFDSQGTAVGQVLLVQSLRTLQGQPVAEGDFRLGSESYIGAGVPLDLSRNPDGARLAVLARSRSSIGAQAAGELLPLLLVAGLVSLALAVVLALLATRPLARPLTELSAAAADVASGNYGRRVAIAGGDEIGKLGNAFNRMAEAVERARAQQRDFLANVSHELKTPLTSLIGFSQALVDGSLRTDAERTRAATILHEEAERVLRMAQELLDLARVESGQVSLRLQPVDLAAQLEQEIEIVRKRAEERGLTLSFVAAPAVPPVAADPERLHQILDNLFDNAVKYAPDGSPIAVRLDAGPDGVTATVSNPVGSHRPDPQRMFDRFYRADPSRASGAGGVGLGLAISRELATAHGGRLWADFDTEGRLSVHLSIPADSSPLGGEGREGTPAETSPVNDRTFVRRTV